MSVVTNLILVIGLDDGPDDGPTDGGMMDKLPAVNRFFAGRPSRGPGLVSLDDPALPRGWYGGSKMMEANLYAGAFNYLDLDAFLAHLRSIDWAEPDAVQVFVQEQDDARWRLIDVMEDAPATA